MGRRTARVLCLLGLVVGLGLTWWLPNPVLNPVPAIQAQARPLPFTDVNPLGANFFLDREVETWKKRETLRMARAAGLGWVKQMFPWDQIEPQKGLFWDDRIRRSTWDKFDEIVDLVEQYGLRLIVRLDQPPEWARSRGENARYPVRDLNEFGDYVARVVARYRGRVQYYQIWNEPNLDIEWGRQPVDPEAYVRLLRVGYERVKKVDPEAYVLAASLAPTIERSAHALSDLEYLQRMYDAGAAAYFDIMSVQAYGLRSGPDDRRVDIDDVNFSRPMLIREIMVRNGDAHKPIWASEVGWNSQPDSVTAEPVFGRVSEELQARYTVRALERARTEWPWMGVMNIWFFRRPHQTEWDQPFFYFRMVDPDFTPRPVWWAVRDYAHRMGYAGACCSESAQP